MLKEKILRFSTTGFWVSMTAFTFCLGAIWGLKHAI